VLYSIIELAVWYSNLSTGNAGGHHAQKLAEIFQMNRGLNY
jgi:hypothetical protein